MLKNKIAEKMDLNTSCEKDILKASHYYNRGGNFYKLLSLLKHRRNRKKYNIEIYPQCKLGKIIIPHAVGIVVGRTAEIGNNTIIMPNVVIGARYSPKESEKKLSGRRHAIIGEDCLLGTGCKIIGKIQIGNNVTVAANAVVTKDVPSNSLVLGINKIVEKGDRNGNKKI